MWHLEIPAAYLMLGGVAFIILLPLVVAGLISRHFRRVGIHSDMESTIADLELRLSWYRDKSNTSQVSTILKPDKHRSTEEVRKTDVSKPLVGEEEVAEQQVFRITTTLKPEIQKTTEDVEKIELPESLISQVEVNEPILTVQAEAITVSVDSNEFASNITSEIQGQNEQSYLDALSENQVKEHENMEQNQLEFDIDEQNTSTGSIHFTPPKITEMQFAAGANPEFLKKLGIFTHSNEVQLPDNVIRFPMVASTPEETLEQAEFDLHLEDVSSDQKKGMHWGHYRIAERYDEGLASCINIESGDRGVFDHSTLAKIDSNEIFTAIVHYKNNSRYVLGLWPGQHDISRRYEEYQEAMGG